jgi:pilus assembly protein Flp/PilA
VTLVLKLAAYVQTLLGRFNDREEGQTMAEYALILALIAVVTAAVIFTLGGQISSVFSSVTGQF